MPQHDLYGLIATAGGIGFLHTLMGPDHYAPFAAMGAARGWSALKTSVVTVLCGVGHLAGSVALGAVGVSLSLALGSLELIEGVRGDIAAWALMAFGLVYLVWGLRRAFRNQPHAHWHTHGASAHAHAHSHVSAHTHVHDEADTGSHSAARSRLAMAWAPWSIFVIFVLGPCEPLIPLLMYPAALHSTAGVAAVVAAFGAATIATMVVMALAIRFGLSQASFRSAMRYGHALAGGAIAVCGASMVFLGL